MHVSNGFVPLGLLDSSTIPFPGGTDILTVVLSARHEELWFHYALILIVVSVIGGCAISDRCSQSFRKCDTLSWLLALRSWPSRLEHSWSYLGITAQYL